MRGGPTSARVNSLDCPRTPFAFLSTEPAHGIRRGQWSAALEVFAAAVGDAIITDFEAGGKAGKGGAGKSLETVSDCVFGAALSLNTLGRKEDSLAAFRLAQRLLQMHPGAPPLHARCAASASSLRVRSQEGLRLRLSSTWTRAARGRSARRASRTCRATLRAPALTSSMTLSTARPAASSPSSSRPVRSEQRAASSEGEGEGEREGG